MIMRYKERRERGMKEVEDKSKDYKDSNKMR